MDRIHINRSSSGDPIFEDPSSPNGRGKDGDVKKETFFGQSIEVTGKDKQGNIQAIKLNKGSLIDYLNTELEIRGEKKLEKGWFIHAGDDKVLTAYRKIFSKEIQPKEVNSATPINPPEVQPNTLTPEVKSATLTPELNAYIGQVNAVKTRIEVDDMMDNMSLPEFSKVVVHTREAIMNKVLESVPKDRDVIFLLGGTGAGKSTTTCFLRGDKMTLHNDKYSSENDKDNIIGHSTKSETFLPNIAITDNLTIVDFPGFEDSKGAAVALGMESALKALLDEYQPKILMLESIKNISGRSTDAASLGSRLNRLLENKQNCILGLTKYSEDGDFIGIKKLEREQKQSRIENKDNKAILKAEIETLTTMIDNFSKKNPKIYAEMIIKRREKLKEKEQELKTLEEQIPNELNEENNEYKIKIENSWAKIQEKEKVLQKQIGINNILRFDNLDNSAEVLNDLLKAKAVNVNPAPRLDQTDKDLIYKLLTDYALNADSFESNDFEDNLQKFSLIETLLLADPDAAKLMSLPDIDPQIIKDVEKKFLEKCLKDCSTLMISHINKLPESQSKLNEQKKFLFFNRTDQKIIDDPQRMDREWSNLSSKSLGQEADISPFIKHLILSTQQNNFLETMHHFGELFYTKSQMS